MDQVILSSPVLNEGELESLLKDPLLKPQVLPTFFDIRKGLDGSLVKTLDRLCEAADEAVRNGSQLLVLSDRFDELVRNHAISNFDYIFIQSRFGTQEFIQKARLVQNLASSMRWELVNNFSSKISLIYLFLLMWDKIGHKNFSLLLLRSLKRYIYKFSHKIEHTKFSLSFFSFGQNFALLLVRF